MMSAREILPPDTEAAFPDNRAHALLLWLSLDSLERFWGAGFPALFGRLSHLQSAARTGLQKRHENPACSVRNEALAAMDPATSALFRDFLARDTFLSDARGLEAWEAFFSAYRSEPEAFGLSDPIAAERLAQHYKEDVSKAARATMTDLRANLTQTPLSDWDMEQHTRYGENYHEDGQGDRSALLSNLGALLSGHLFDRFLKSHVLSLSDQDQRALHAAVQAEWDETLEDPMLAAVPSEARVPHAGEVVSP